MARNHRGHFMRPMIVIGFMAVVLFPVVPHAQSIQGTQSDSLRAGADRPDVSFIGRSVKILAAEGYAIDGPSEVAKVDGASITIYSGRKKDPTLNFEGQKVTVKDYQDHTFTLADIQPKMKIYTCRKQNEVIIFVLQKKERTNDH